MNFITLSLFGQLQKYDFLLKKLSQSISITNKKSKNTALLSAFSNYRILLELGTDRLVVVKMVDILTIAMVE